MYGLCVIYRNFLPNSIKTVHLKLSSYLVPSRSRWKEVVMVLYIVFKFSDNLLQQQKIRVFLRKEARLKHTN